MNENQEAEALTAWLRNNLYVFTHVANESGLPKKYAMLAAIRKKRMGLSPGFPDYCIVLKRGALLFIELKKKRTFKQKSTEYRALSSDGILKSEEQEEWIKELGRIDNVEAHFCFGHEEAIELIKSYD